MIYEIRLKGREKQGECSAILTMTFLVMTLMTLTLNLMPMVYSSAVKPMLQESDEGKIITLAISSVLIFLFFVLLSCLSYGADRFMLKRAENTVAGAGDIFYYFSPIRTFSLMLFLVKFSIYKISILALLSGPFVICAVVFVSFCNRGFSALVCGIFALFTLVFLISALVAYWKINDTLFLVRYRFIKGDYINFRQLLAQSQLDMTKKLHRLRSLRASFIGWFFLCLLILPLPYVWSYYRQTKACFSVMD